MFSFFCTETKSELVGLPCLLALLSLGRWPWHQCCWQPMWKPGKKGWKRPAWTQWSTSTLAWKIGRTLTSKSNDTSFIGSGCPSQYGPHQMTWPILPAEELHFGCPTCPSNFCSLRRWRFWCWSVIVQAASRAEMEHTARTRWKWSHWQSRKRCRGRISTTAIDQSFSLSFSQSTWPWWWKSVVPQLTLGNSLQRRV